MTRNEVQDIITAIARQYGFKTVEDNWGFRIEDETRTVNFTIHEEHDYDMPACSVHVTLKVVASIATMGGNPTGNDLRVMAQTIDNAGRLVNVLSDRLMKNQMTYTIKYSI